MEIMGSGTHKKAGLLARGLWCLKVLLEKFRSKFCEIASNTKKLGKDDPRRVIHSLKVGLAISLVSLFYYYQPLYNNFGVSAMWAVMTVVVVFEFTVGATLGKGLNRGLATLAAGALGVGAHHLANLSGHIAEPILLGFFVFLQATTSTFIRFFPKVRARYDYGLLIFILTFSLVSVSGFRDDEILELAGKRLSTIIIGGVTCVIISILVCPVWAGEDLHNLIALNLEKIGIFLEGFGREYFNTLENEDSKSEDKKFLKGYKIVLISKSSEESLANFASWEPRHGRFGFRHPWKNYLKIGTLTRQCAYRLEALHSSLNADIQASNEIKERIKETCTKMSLECGKALKELASTIKEMTQTSYVESHIENAKAAAKSLSSLLKLGLWDDSNLFEVIPAVTVASLLLDVVSCCEEIVQSVNELAYVAKFQSEVSNKNKSQVEHCDPEQTEPYVVVTIKERETNCGNN